MPTRKRSTSPSATWLYPAGELQALTMGTTDPAYEMLSDLAFNWDMEYVSDVEAFCEGAQPSWSSLVLDDFPSGAWLDKLKAIARAGFYYRLCEEY